MVIRFPDENSKQHSFFRKFHSGPPLCRKLSVKRAEKKPAITKMIPLILLIIRFSRANPLSLSLKRFTVSSMKVENVVNPPTIPIRMNVRESDDALKRIRTSHKNPTANDPDKLTARVPHGNIPSAIRETKAVKRYRRTVPTAPPRAAYKSFIKTPPNYVSRSHQLPYCLWHGEYGKRF